MKILDLTDTVIHLKCNQMDMYDYLSLSGCNQYFKVTVIKKYELD